MQLVLIVPYLCVQTVFITGVLLYNLIIVNPSGSLWFLPREQASQLKSASKSASEIIGLNSGHFNYCTV